MEIHTHANQTWFPLHDNNGRDPWWSINFPHHTSLWRMLNFSTHSVSDWKEKTMFWWNGPWYLDFTYKSLCTSNSSSRCRTRGRHSRRQWTWQEHRPWQQLAEQRILEVRHVSHWWGQCQAERYQISQWRRKFETSYQAQLQVSRLWHISAHGSMWLISPLEVAAVLLWRILTEGSTVSSTDAIAVSISKVQQILSGTECSFK